MSKPGGKAIVRRRPFYRDKYFEIYADRNDRNEIVLFEFIDKVDESNSRTFQVSNYQILKAWEKLQEHVNPIVGKLLRPNIAKRK